LASQLRISYHQVQNYEKGKHRVSVSCLMRIAEFLETPVENFLPKN